MGGGSTSGHRDLGQEGAWGARGHLGRAEGAPKAAKVLGGAKVEGEQGHPGG